LSCSLLCPVFIFLPFQLWITDNISRATYYVISTFLSHIFGVLLEQPNGSRTYKI
jgi:hypothetical protein